MLGLGSRNCPSPVRNNSILRMLIFLVVPSLLHIPILYYSLTTPFGLVDDYVLSGYVRIFNDSFLGWLDRTFLNFSDSRARYRPFWEIYNAITWSLFGATPWMHHLSRWILHFGAVFTFYAAFRVFSRKSSAANSTVPAECEKLDDLLPLIFLVYIYVFFPNSPSSRLGPLEVYFVSFFGLCTWMTALILSKRSRGRTSSSILEHVVFHVGYVGLCWSKEVGVAVAAWILIFYYVFLVPGNNWKKFMSSTPLALIFFHTTGMVYVASKTSGTGYKNIGVVPEPFYENAIRLLKGLFQIETSLWLTVGFTILSVISLLSVVIKIVNRKLTNESLFFLFLLGSFMSMFSFLSLSYGVVLRYWHVLIPIFAMLLAFSIKFIFETIRRRHAIFTYLGVTTLTGFVVFFVVVNYYNSLFQTTVQHALRYADGRLVSEIFHLIDRGEHVQIDHTGAYVENQLLYFLPRHSAYFHHRNRHVRKDKPEVGREYFFITRKTLPVLGDPPVTIVPYSNYPLLSYASRIASFLQGKPAFLETDGGVHSPDRYQWNIHRLTSGEVKFSVPSEAQKLLIRSKFDVYFNHAQNMLTFFKESCRKEDLRAPFFLHVIPVDIEDLPGPRKEYRFDNLDFFFHDYGILDGSKCAAARRLPDYPISKISTGQYIEEARLWEGISELDGQSGSDLLPFTTP